YTYKIDIWRQLSDGGPALRRGPQENVDYGKIAARAPKLNAQLEYMDKALFDATPLVFATLIDPRPDSLNHLSHLIITKAERDRLVKSLEISFGAKLQTNNQNYTVGAASLLKMFLTEKHYACSDEPWK